MASSPSAAHYQAAHRTAVASVRDRVQAFITAAWGGLTAWRSADIDRFVNRVVPVVLAGQGQAAALTDAYLANVAAVTLGTPPRVVGIKPETVSGAAVRNGTPPQDVYRRAGHTVWTALAAGTALDVAVRMGQARALSAAAMDLQLAVTHTSRLIMANDQRVTSYKRTLSGKSCELCISAAQDTYRTDALMPVHNRCSCGVAPIYGGRSSVGSFLAGAAIGAVVAVVHEHGEVGPVLGVKGQNFTGPEDI